MEGGEDINYSITNNIPTDVGSYTIVGNTTKNVKIFKQWIRAIESALNNPVEGSTRFTDPTDNIIQNNITELVRAFIEIDKAAATDGAAATGPCQESIAISSNRSLCKFLNIEPIKSFGTIEVKAGLQITIINLNPTALNGQYKIIKSDIFDTRFSTANTHIDELKAILPDNDLKSKFDIIISYLSDDNVLIDNFNT